VVRGALPKVGPPDLRPSRQTAGLGEREVPLPHPAARMDCH